jgi:hypothetical protein
MRKLVVVDIEDDVQLVIYVLMGERDDRADILLSKGVIQLQGHCIPCIIPGERNVGCILRSADELTISAMSETIALAFIEITAQDGPKNENLLIESSSTFSENFSLLMAPAAINIAKRITVPVRVINHFNELKTVYRDAVLGTGVPNE